MRLGPGTWDRAWAGRAAVGTTVASAWGRGCHLGFGVRRTWVSGSYLKVGSRVCGREGATCMGSGGQLLRSGKRSRPRSAQAAVWDHRSASGSGASGWGWGRGRGWGGLWLEGPCLELRIVPAIGEPCLGSEEGACAGDEGAGAVIWMRSEGLHLGSGMGACTWACGPGRAWSCIVAPVVGMGGGGCCAWVLGDRAVPVHDGGRRLSGAIWTRNGGRTWGRAAWGPGFRPAPAPAHESPAACWRRRRRRRKRPATLFVFLGI